MHIFLPWYYYIVLPRNDVGVSTQIHRDSWCYFAKRLQHSASQFVGIEHRAARKYRMSNV